MKISLLFIFLVGFIFSISIGANTFDDLSKGAIKWLNKKAGKKNRYKYIKYGSMSMSMDTIELQITVRKDGKDYEKKVIGKEVSGRMVVQNVINIDDDTVEENVEIPIEKMRKVDLDLEDDDDEF